MPFTVIYDACVLYPPGLRDLLLTLVQQNSVHGRCTKEIIGEAVRSIARTNDIAPERLERTRFHVENVRPGWLVESYEPLMAGLLLPDPNDRHVLAAAIKVGAQAIITFNLKDFPVDALGQWGIEPLHPDVFLSNTIELDPEGCIRAIQTISARLKNPPLTALDLAGRLQKKPTPQHCGEAFGAPQLMVPCGTINETASATPLPSPS